MKAATRRARARRAAYVGTSRTLNVRREPHIHSFFPLESRGKTTLRMRCYECPKHETWKVDSLEEFGIFTPTGILNSPGVSIVEAETPALVLNAKLTPAEEKALRDQFKEKAARPDRVMVLPADSELQIVKKTPSQVQQTLEVMTRPALEELARQKGLKVTTKTTKATMVAMLVDYYSATPDGIMEPASH